MLDDFQVLIVQSQSSLAAVIGRVAERAGLRPTITPDCRSAYDVAARREHPLVLVEYHDLVLADAGFRQLLQTRRGEGALVAVLSTSLDRGVSEWAREGLWDFVLLKPFSPTELRLKLTTRGCRVPAPPEWFLQQPLADRRIEERVLPTSTIVEL